MKINRRVNLLDVGILDNVIYCAHSYNLDELRKGMMVYDHRLRRIVKIVNVYYSCQLIYLRGIYGGIRFENGRFWALKE